MKYMGSKARHAKDIIPFLKDSYQEGMIYIEPFVGGANMFDKVDFVPNALKYGCDVHEYLIAMWQAVSLGWEPPDLITEEQYNYIKQNKDEDKALTGYVGFALSYGGKWFGGYRRDIKGTADNPELKLQNEKEQSRRSRVSLIKQSQQLSGCKFILKSVFDIKGVIHKALIYCDPPYRGTTKYKDSFDHERFYEWCREKKRQGHVVFVSEYWMPEDFTCVWEKEVKSSLTSNTGGKKGVEKLFTL